MPSITAPPTAMIGAASALVTMVTNTEAAITNLLTAIGKIPAELQKLLTVGSGSGISLPNVILPNFEMFAPPFTPDWSPLDGMDACAIALNVPTVLSVILSVIALAIKSFIGYVIGWIDTQIVRFVNGFIDVEGEINRWWTTTKTSYTTFITDIRISLENSNKNNPGLQFKIMKRIQPIIDKICILISDAEKAVKTLIGAFEKMANDLGAELDKIIASIEDCMKGIQCLNKIQTLAA
jgi:hypothetical protein